MVAWDDTSTDVIASLLPGVRELRTPLAAGYLWLLSFWLLFDPIFPSREEATGVYESISRLIEEGSIVGLGAAVSFIAYLVGTVYVGLLRAPLALFRFRRARRDTRTRSAKVGQAPSAAPVLLLSWRGVTALMEFVHRILVRESGRLDNVGKAQVLNDFFREARFDPAWEKAPYVAILDLDHQHDGIHRAGGI